MAVGLDPAAIVQPHADLLQAEALGVGTAPDRDQDGIALDGLGGAALGRLDRHPDRLSRRVHARDLGAELEYHALLLQDLLEFLRHFAVHAGRDPVEKLDHGDLGPQPAPDRAHLEADIAGTDHEQVLGHPLEIERAGGGDDAVLVDGDAGQRHDVGAGGDQHVLGRELLDRAIVAQLRHDLARALDPAGAEHVVDLVLLEQELDALGQGLHDLVLVAQHRRQVELDAAHLDAVPGHAVPGLLEQMRGVQQRLGRDAADIEAGAAERAALLDAGDLEPELGRLDRGHVAAWPAAHDHQIVPRLAHDPTPPYRALRLPHPSGAAPWGHAPPATTSARSGP